MSAPRIFRDSTTPARISVSGTNGVLAYYNGDYAWPLTEINRFRDAGKQVRHIDVNGTGWRQAAILDVERFDATPATARGWIPQRNEHYNDDATIYIQRTNLDELFQECDGLPYWLIIADWTGVPHDLASLPLPKGVRIAGVQFETIPNIYDVTAIYDPAWYPVKKAA